jgi:uncharacterized damage-inducible protein DinB
MPERQTREQLADAFEKETATTQRVLQAYPSDQGEMKPHPKAKSARELGWMFTLSQMLALKALRGELDLSAGFPPAPESMDEVKGGFAAAAAELVNELRNASDEAMRGTTRFFTAPKTMGDIPNPAFLWFLLHDHIHHRGQFSIYLRMAGGKVPSIYGPSADEPWF